jgi:hypothetical protein
VVESRLLWPAAAPARHPWRESRGPARRRPINAANVSGYARTGSNNKPEVVPGVPTCYLPATCYLYLQPPTTSSSSTSSSPSISRVLFSPPRFCHFPLLPVTLARLLPRVSRDFATDTSFACRNEATEDARPIDIPPLPPYVSPAAIRYTRRIPSILNAASRAGPRPIRPSLARFGLVLRVAVAALPFARHHPSIH